MTEDTSSSSERDVGPIEYIAVEFPGAKMKGEAFAELVKLVDAGIIRILDLQVATVGEGGEFTVVELTDLDGDGQLDMAMFSGVASGLIDDDDLAQGAGLVNPGDAFGLLVFENTWAGPFLSALRRADAQLIDHGRIPVADVLEAMDALEAAGA